MTSDLVTSIGWLSKSEVKEGGAVTRGTLLTSDKSVGLLCRSLGRCPHALGSLESAEAIEGASMKKS